MAVKTVYKHFTRTYSIYNSVYMSIIINVLVAVTWHASKILNYISFGRW